MNSPRNRLFLLPSLVLFLLAVALNGTAVSLEAPVELTILHVSDFHGHFQPFDCASGTAMGGYARLKAYKGRLEASGRKVLLLCSGDAIQGTMAFRFFGGFPDIEMMNLCGFSGMALGNHEFDGKLDVFCKAFGKARFPLLSANLHFPPGSPIESLVKPFLFLDVPIGSESLKVALIGLTDEMLLDTMPRGFLPGVQVDDAFKTLRRLLPKINKGKPDAIFVLSHLGWPRELGLAEEFSDLSGVLGGHTHLFVDPPILRKTDRGHQVLSEPGEYGRSLTRYDLRFSPSGSATRMEVVGAALVGMTSDLPQDPVVKAEVDRYASETSEKGKTVLGEAMCRLEGDRPMIRMQETNLGNLIADGMVKALPADMALVNGGGIRVTVPKGPITIGTCLDVLPFENYLTRVKLTGRNLQRLVEQIADGILFFPGYGGFPHISGGAKLKIGYDGVTLELGGKPIEPEKTYSVTTMDFLSTGGNGMSEFLGAVSSETSPILISDSLIEMVKSLGKVEPKIEGRLEIDRTPPKTSSGNVFFRRGTVWGDVVEGFSLGRRARELMFRLQMVSGTGASSGTGPAVGMIPIPFPCLPVPPLPN